ncbi:hypothetical protein LTR17_003003 [Elasticomyces elasticus]|nr:hypothetical protein LTR17_003003 [Elasticomyces elasticus]
MTLSLNENTDAAQGERAVRARCMPGTLLDLADRITGLHSGLPQVLSGLDLMSTRDAVGCLVFFASAKRAAIIFRHPTSQAANMTSLPRVLYSMPAAILSYAPSKPPSGPTRAGVRPSHLDVSHPLEGGLGPKRHGRINRRITRITRINATRNTDPRHSNRLPPHRTMGKPRTSGPASKKRKADDARYTEGEEGMLGA